MDLLREAGLHVTVSSLFSDNYVERLYAGLRADVSKVVSGYINRIRAMLTARSFDLIWIEREVLPWVPQLAERVLLPRRVPYAVDFDDAVFHRYDAHPSAFVRMVLGSKIDRLMSRAAVVIAGNEYIADRARAAGTRRVEILPTVVDLNQYEARGPAGPGCPVIGWIGTPQTQSFLEVASQALVELRRRRDFRLLLIGADRRALPALTFDELTWSEETEAASLRKLDIGIMPLTETPFAKGKCGYKLIQYMACEIPVVASPVGMNATLVTHGRNGFVARSAREWVESLDTLLSDQALRARMGAEGRRLVAEQYSLDVAAPQLVRILREACGNPAYSAHANAIKSLREC